MPVMSELPEHQTEPKPPKQQKPYWLFQFAAWVVIVAGITFIVSTIFFTGAYVAKGGWHGHHHCHHHDHSMNRMGPEHRGPGPELPPPGRPGPGELPPSIAPAVPGR